MKNSNLKNLLINNKELLLGIIVGLMLSSTAVFGVIKYASSNVFYRNTNSHLTSTTVQSAIDELYGRCTTTPYTLTADAKGGVISATAGWTISGSTATKTVIFNGVYGVLPSVTKTGYSFDGWYTKETGGTQVTSSSIYRYSSNSTIYAHWSTNTYTISYTMNGGNNPNPKPTSGSTDSVVSIGTTTQTTKTVTVTGDDNGTGADIDPSTTYADQQFGGWSSSSSEGLGSNAKTGKSSNPTTAWSGTKTTNKYFKNLRDTSGTVTLTANWTPVAFNLPTISKEGWTCKWNTKADGTGTDYDSGASYTPTANSEQNITMYAKCTGNTYTGTFYYQSNTTSGSTTVSSKTAQCTVTSGNSCTVTIPSEVTGSGGTYNNKYAGLSTSTGNMTEAVSGSATTVSLTATRNYYSLYRTTITIAYPTSTSAATTKTTYQNQWFTSTSAMATTVLSSSSTGTSANATYGTIVSGYSLVGFNASTNTNTATWTSIANLTKSNSSKSASRDVYQIDKKEEEKTATFYYQSSSTNGTCSVAEATASGTQTTLLRTTSKTAAATTINDENITIPSVVTGSVGRYNNAYAGVALGGGSMSPATVNTATLTYYAYYRSSVTNYYWNGSSYASRTLYRNMTLAGSEVCGTTYLSTTNTGLSNYSTALGPNSSLFAGLSTGNDTTAEYSNVAGAAQSNSSTLYTVYQYNVVYSKGLNIDSLGSTSGNCKFVSSTTAGATTPNSCSVTLPSITPNANYTSVGWATSSGATSGTPAGGSWTINSTPTTLFANAYPTVSYNAGETCTSATGMPSSQIKLPNEYYQPDGFKLQTGTPTCSGKAFLGWSPTSSADEDSTWYDPGDTYNTEAPLTLYAQFYDVKELEDAYTSFVQSGDYNYMGTDNFGGENIEEVFGMHGFTLLYSELWGTFPENYVDAEILMGYLHSPFRVTHIASSAQELQTIWGKKVIMNSTNYNTRFYKMILPNHPTDDYENYDIDNRIDMLQKTSDVAIKYDDLETVAKVQDNLVVKPGNNPLTVTNAVDSGYEYVSNAGFNISNATTNGIGMSRVFVTGNYFENITGGRRNKMTLLNADLATSTTDARVKLTTYIVQSLKKQTRDETFDPQSDEGLNRYIALEELNSNKNNYITKDSFKIHTVNGATTSTTAWGSGTATGNVSIPNGKILGVVEHGVRDASSTTTTGNYASINKVIVNIGNDGTTGSLNMQFYGANNNNSTNTGTAMTNVYGFGRIIYVSSGYMTSN